MKKKFIFLRWAITGVYLAVLYLTLGITRDIVEPLRAAGRLTIIVVMALAGGSAATIFWRFRVTTKGRLCIRVLLVTVLFALSFYFPLPEERLHLVMYGLLGWLFSWSLDDNGHLKKIWYVWPLLFVWCAGIVDETIQWYLPDRVFDLRDIFLNGVSGMAGIAIYFTGMEKARLQDN